MRLIDSKALKCEVMEGTFMPGLCKMLVNRVIDEQPSIDPESLPIVQELRKRLAFYERLPKFGSELYWVVNSRRGASEGEKIRKITVDEVVNNESGWYVVCYYYKVRTAFELDEIGKTIFLTREEAEATMRKSENHGL